MKLFEPIQIGTMTLKNRLVMAPMATHYADENGAVTPRLINYYAERARGGVGLVITESGYVHPLGRGGLRRMGLHHDDLVPGFKKLVEAVHSEGAKIASLLHHAGRQINVAIVNGMYPVSASSIPAALEGIVPRTLKIAEIEELVEAFGQAARRSLAAGFDAVVIHAAHGYLIHQFLSPTSNTRQDRFGGNFVGRIRFLKEVVFRCREIVGRDYPLMVRISASEFIPGGLTLKDGQRIAWNLEKWGVDAIHVSGGTHETQEMELQPMAIPRGCLVHLADGIKKLVRIPVATVGRIVEPLMAEEILQQGKADLITLGRALLADPEFPRKAREGKAEDIRPCIGCLQGCRDRLYQGQPIGCLVNPLAGFEAEYKLTPATLPRKVLIIGGGPAGLEAARVAALRGHSVTLWEKENRLGGQFHLASIPPGKGEIKSYVDYQIRQMRDLKVEVRLGQKMSADALARSGADVILLAAGASPSRPDIPGADRENVLTAWEVLENPEKTGQKVLVVGGGAVGAETATFLADPKKEVTLIEMLKDLALDEERINRKLLLRRLGEKGVKVRVMTQAKAIGPEGVEVEFNGRREILPADTVVLAIGVKANRELEESIKNLNVKIYTIGDCASPRKALEAIQEGFRAALEI